MAKRLYIDLEKCRECDSCSAKCSYFYHPYNNGVIYLREIGEFATTCRKCEKAPCVISCPHDALEKQENGILKRYNMRCVACNTCSYACPFGTIFPEVIPYATSKCDYCLNRLIENEKPMCIEGCEEDAIKYGEFEPNKKEYEFLINDNLIVRSVPWKKEEYI